MTEQVWNYVCENHMLTEKDRVVAGISGGADSVCLLLLLLEFQKRLPFELCAVHVDHGIRGEEARKDAEFTQRLCLEKNVEFRLVCCDVPKRAREEGLSVEDAGRRCRYEALEQVRSEWGGTRIAVAHHKNDQAETLLLHLFRGTGLKGMCGMAPVKDVLIRPLLCIERREIEAWLKEHMVSYRTDSTNLLDDYARNRIRNRILTEAVQINAQAVGHLADACSMAREAQDYLEREAERACSRVVRAAEGEWFLDREAFGREDALIQKYVLLRVLESCCRGRKDLTADHVKALIGLMEQPVGKQLMLPGGLYARSSYGGMYIGCGRREHQPQEYPVAIPGTVFLEDGGKISFDLMPYKKELQIPRKTYTKWLDYDKIKSSLKLRTRCEGDYITVNRQGGTRKLKDYFIDQKIDRLKRDRVLLLADGSHILWVIGYRISEAFRVTEETEYVLRVQAEGGNFHE